MLIRQQVLRNKIRLLKYERAKYNCKSKAAFIDCLQSPERVLEFASFCNQFDLQPSSFEFSEDSRQDGFGDFGLRVDFEASDCQFNFDDMCFDDLSYQLVLDL